MQQKNIIYTNHNRFARIYANKFKLGLKVEEGRSYHLGAVTAPQYCQFLHYKINLITPLTHHVNTQTWSIRLEVGCKADDLTV
jgi:hypothetical protein